MNNKAHKKPNFESKLSSNKSTGSKKLLQFKNAKQTESKNEPNLSQIQTQNNRMFLTYTISNTEEFKVKNKEIEDLKKNKLTEYNITLSSVFEKSRQVLALCLSLGQIGPSIKELVWNVEGRLTDDGYSEEIGIAIGKMTNAYSIVLNIGDSKFGDKAATILGKRLSHLNKLKVLKLNIGTDYDNKTFLTYEGRYKIAESIKALSQLQVFETNVFALDYKKDEWKLNNCVLELENKFDERNKFSLLLTLEDFPNQIKQRQSYHITQLLLRIRQRRTYSYYSIDRITYETAKAVLLNAVRYSIHSFQYLTMFTNEILNSHDMKELINSNSNLIKFVETFKQYISSKLATVVQIQVFNEYLKAYQMINPFMILSDLYID